MEMARQPMAMDRWSFRAPTQEPNMERRPLGKSRRPLGMASGYVERSFIEANATARVRRRNPTTSTRLRLGQRQLELGQQRLGMDTYKNARLANAGTMACGPALVASGSGPAAAGSTHRTCNHNRRNRSKKFGCLHAVRSGLPVAGSGKITTTNGSPVRCSHAHAASAGRMANGKTQLANGRGRLGSSATHRRFNRRRRSRSPKIQSIAPGIFGSTATMNGATVTTNGCLAIGNVNARTKPGSLATGTTTAARGRGLRARGAKSQPLTSYEDFAPSVLARGQMSYNGRRLCLLQRYCVRCPLR